LLIFSFGLHFAYFFFPLDCTLLTFFPSDWILLTFSFGLYFSYCFFSTDCTFLRFFVNRTIWSPHYSSTASLNTTKPWLQDKNARRLDWIKDAKMRATFQRRDGLMECMRRSGAMYDRWSSGEECVSEAWGPPAGAFT
jgi:hypothetical protein